MDKSQDIFEKCYGDGGYFGKFRYKGDNKVTRPTLPILPETHINIDGKDCIMWSINNYLGLSNHPEILKVSKESVAKYGLSAPMGSRMMSGTTENHLALERKFAKWTGKEAAYLFNYGYMGILGIVTSLAGPNDTIVMDKLAHASIVDAAFSSHTTTRIFKHSNVKDLENILKKIREKKPEGGILILLEGIYGMTGDIAPLKEIIAIKHKYNARLFIDDAHGCGVLGLQGRGVGDHCGVMEDIDIYFGTFAKAFVAIGGFAVADKAVIEWIGYNARTQVFAKSLPIVFVQTVDKTLDIVIESEDRRKLLRKRSNQLKDGLRNIGFHIGAGESSIVSVFIPLRGDNPIEFMAPTSILYLREQGVFVTGIVHPVIPHGLLMYRLVPTVLHTEQDIEQTVAIFNKMKNHLNLDTHMDEKELSLLKKIYFEN